MGGWTKWAIWGFTGWKAEVASDYLFSRCYKASKGGCSGLACLPLRFSVALPVLFRQFFLSVRHTVIQLPPLFFVHDFTWCPPHISANGKYCQAQETR